MKASIVICCYNYADYIGQCLESAVAQSYADLEIIVVDDGSTDDSLKIIQQSLNDDTRARVIQKKNGGQLSTFNTALDYISGDIVFFLDADDWYDPEYVMDCMRFYKSTVDCDFLCGNMIRSRDGEDTPHYDSACEIGYSAFRAYYLHDWIGRATSAISMRLATLRMILPLPFERDWRIRADDCLILGASIVGAKKYFRQDSVPAAYYRIHGKNAYFGAEPNGFEQEYRYRVAIDKLCQYLVIHNYIMLPPRRAVDEFKSSENRNFKTFMRYVKVIGRLPTGSIYKLYLLATLTIVYLQGSN